MLLAAGAVAVSPSAYGQATATDFPTEVVRIIVPFPPGGGVDTMARAIAAELSTRWKQSVIVENKGGAGSIIGAQQVARAKPDGHTLLATVNQTLVANGFLYKNLPYDPSKDFVPVTMMVESDQMIIANADLPVDDLPGLIALARRDPKALNYGSFAKGSQPHLAFELLNQREKLDILHVPYNGVAPMLTALGGGTVKLTTVSANVAAPLIAAGKTKPIAVAGKERVKQFPNVPTTAESGHGYLQTSIWYGLFAPAGTPDAVVRKIQADVKSILDRPEFAEKQATSKGMRVVASDPKSFAASLKTETETVGAIVRAAGIQPE